MARPARPRSISTIVSADSARWDIDVPLAWALLIAPLVLMAAMMVIGAVYERGFNLLINEDHPIEWLQFFVMAAAAPTFAVCAIRARRRDRAGLMVLYGIIALACVVIAGEEISWGQRILGLATPAVLQGVNRQGEANIHNIGIVQRSFNLGEMIAGLYGLALPILWAVPRIRTRLGRLDPIVVPPICLVALFFLPFAYRATRLVFLPDVGERLVKLGEVPELTFYVGGLVMGIATARVLGTGRSLEA